MGLFGFLGGESIKVILDKKEYLPGDVIQAKIILTVKKPKLADKFEAKLLHSVPADSSYQMPKDEAHQITQIDEGKEYTSGEYRVVVQIPVEPPGTDDWPEPDSPGMKEAWVNDDLGIGLNFYHLQAILELGTIIQLKGQSEQFVIKYKR